MIKPAKEQKKTSVKPITQKYTSGTATAKKPTAPKQAQNAESLDSYKELLAGQEDYKKAPTEPLTDADTDLGTEDPEDDFDGDENSLENVLVKKGILKTPTAEDKAEDAEQ
jgi:hypothetical protein